MRKVQPGSNRSNTKLKVRIDAKSAEAEVFHWPDGSEIDSGQLLLPTAVKGVLRRLEAEAEMLCGKRYEQGNEYARWGTEKGSVYPGGQKVRNARGRKEAEAHAAKLEKVLRKANLSAHASFIEAKEDLLVLHELCLSQQLKAFFSTTNPIESLNGLLEEDTRRVKRWHDSSHFQRWVATAVLENEKRMRRPRGFQRIAGLGTAVHRLCRISRVVKWVVDEARKAAQEIRCHSACEFQRSFGQPQPTPPRK